MVVPPEGTVQSAVKVSDAEYIDLQSTALTFEL